MVDTIDPAAHGEASAAPGWQPAAAPLMSAKAPDGQPRDDEEELPAEAWHSLAHRFLEASSFLQQRPLTGTKVVLFPEGYLQSRRVLGLPADAPMWQRSNATLPPRPIASGETASVQRARYLVQRASGHLLARVRLVRGGGTAPREWVELDVHPENGTADFIIHRQRYQDALAKSWRPGQRFRSFFASPGDPSAGSYFYGRVAAAQKRRASAWEGLHVSWDGEEEETQLSPWEIEAVDDAGVAIGLESGAIKRKGAPLPGSAGEAKQPKLAFCDRPEGAVVASPAEAAAAAPCGGPLLLQYKLGKARCALHEGRPPPVVAPPPPEAQPSARGSPAGSPSTPSSTKPKRSSRFRGVSCKGHRWVANLWFRGRQHYLGSHPDEAAAAAAYDAGALRLCGSGAVLNFPEEAAARMGDLQRQDLPADETGAAAAPMPSPQSATQPPCGLPVANVPPNLRPVATSAGNLSLAGGLKEVAWSPRGRPVRGVRLEQVQSLWEEELGLGERPNRKPAPAQATPVGAAPAPPPALLPEAPASLPAAANEEDARSQGEVETPPTPAETTEQAPPRVKKANEGAKRPSAKAANKAKRPRVRKKRKAETKPPPEATQRGVGGPGRGGRRWLGVSWSKRDSKWVSTIRHPQGKARYLGYFESAESAARAFDAAAIKLKGADAKLNFPDDAPWATATGDAAQATDLAPATTANEEEAAQQLASLASVLLSGREQRPKGAKKKRPSSDGRGPQTPSPTPTAAVARHTSKTIPAAKATSPATSDATGAGPARPRRGGSSSFRGVSWIKTMGRWVAGIGCKGEKHYLGAFKSEREAARAYDRAALRLLGPAATTNFPPGDYPDAVLGALEGDVTDSTTEDSNNQTPDNGALASLASAALAGDDPDLPQAAPGARTGSLFIGVRLEAPRDASAFPAWRALCPTGGAVMNLGTYATEEQAAMAYDSAALALWGPCAVLNLPPRLHALLGASQIRPEAVKLSLVMQPGPVRLGLSTAPGLEAVTAALRVEAETVRVKLSVVEMEAGEGNDLGAGVTEASPGLLAMPMETTANSPEPEDAAMLEVETEPQAEGALPRVRSFMDDYGSGLESVAGGQEMPIKRVSFVVPTAASSVAAAVADAIAA